MARTKKGTPPAYPTTPHNGQARLSVTLTNGKRHCIYLGPFGSLESRQAYSRTLAVLEAHDGRFPVQENGSASGRLTLNEIADQFWRHAESHYRLADGSPSREQDHFQLALRQLLKLFGDTCAEEFGPLRFKAVRQQLIQARQFFVLRTDTKGASPVWLPEDRMRAEEALGLWGHNWIPVAIQKIKPALARRVINQRMDHVKRFFAWAVSDELVTPAVHEAMLRVSGLRRGHQGTRETPRVQPVPDKHVDATLVYLVPQVAAMVQVQSLIGGRPTEVCLIRGRNIIDRDQPVWKYVIDPNDVLRAEDSNGRLANLHKCANHDDAEGHAKVKILPIGPKAQAILKVWLRDNPDEYLFQPCEARARRYAERREQRKTPLYLSHALRQSFKQKANPKRAPRDHYDRHSYSHAVARAAKKAGVPHWHPHQLKHVCGTRVRERYGAEAAQSFLGHEKLSTTEIYAEKNWRLVERIAADLG
jgi:integrase